MEGRDTKGRVAEGSIETTRRGAHRIDMNDLIWVLYIRKKGDDSRSAPIPSFYLTLSTECGGYLG